MLPAMIKEAVRDITINGQRNPRGTYITYSASVTNRDPELWGSGADDFDPEKTAPDGVSCTGK